MTYTDLDRVSLDTAAAALESQQGNFRVWRGLLMKDIQDRHVDDETRGHLEDQLATITDGMGENIDATLADVNEAIGVLDGRAEDRERVT